MDLEPIVIHRVIDADGDLLYSVEYPDQMGVAEVVGALTMATHTMLTHPGDED